jgi:UDP-glucose 4-epimerase
MTTVSLRLFNVFGPRQNPETENAAVVARFILQALKNEPLVIFGDGGQTRDFIFVEDVVQTMHKLINRKDIPGPINLGSERAISLNDLASMIIVQTKSTSRIIHQNSRLGDSRDSISTNTTLLQLGWKTSFDFEVGLSKTVAWYRETLEVKNRTRSSTCPSS